MIQTLTKISFILVLLLLFTSCDAVKNVNDGEYLLTNNDIIVDSLLIKDPKVNSLLFQHPNTKALGIPLGLHIYNLADVKPDSTFQKWLHKKPKREKRMVDFYSQKQVDRIKNNYIGFNKWIQKTGNNPVIVREGEIKKSINRLEHYYSTLGWFNANASYSVEKSDNKRAAVTYNIRKSRPYSIGTITEQINSPIVDSLYHITKQFSFIKPDKQYDANDFNSERDRLTLQFRNSGLYYFDQSYIEFEADSVNTGYKANIIYQIPDRKYKINDSTYTEPFKIHRVSEVRIITDYSFSRLNDTFKDSINFNGYKLYSYEKFKFKPKAITDAIAIKPNGLYKELERTLTYNQISDLKIFKYPKISYVEDPKDTTGQDLIATILLTPRKKYSLSVVFDTFTSTIQQFGIGFRTSFQIRNVFKNAEILELSVNGSVGASKDAGDSNSSFFNNSDIGSAIKLSFPRILFPLKTEKIIPKFMSPLTSVSIGFNNQHNIGFNNQHNIGLDRKNINTIFNYRWRPRKTRLNQLDLINVQFVRNLNPENYYDVYTSSYAHLNQIAIDTGRDFADDTEPLNLIIPEETTAFILAVGNNDESLNIDEEQEEEVPEITERQIRLTENNLIFAINYTWTRDTRENNNDTNFYRVRWKVESAGALLNGIAKIAELEKDEFGKYLIGDVAFSQYIKFEGEYIKHWDFGFNNILAFRTFSGIAIPYGNGNSIPFTKSYFAGGSNDNRGWKAYDLGPGSSGSVLDFNEANFKIAFNLEHRYKIIGPINGTFFIDVGNIWNALDNITDPRKTFTSLQDLRDIAVSSGFGLRYDFGFFVFRLDIGFKTYDPAYPLGQRWFNDYNFGNAVYNIGINYTF